MQKLTIKVLIYIWAARNNGKIFFTHEREWVGTLYDSRASQESMKDVRSLEKALSLVFLSGPNYIHGTGWQNLLKFVELYCTCFLFGWLRFFWIFIWYAPHFWTLVKMSRILEDFFCILQFESYVELMNKDN